MKRVDLRSGIIPTRIKNTDENQKKGNKKFDTVDYIFLDSYEDQFENKKTFEERRISATDHAKMTNCWTSRNYETRTGKETCASWLRSALNRSNVKCIDRDGDWDR